MFTGIVAETGALRSVRPGPKSAALELAATFDALALGESIAVDGVCLTVTEVVAGGFRCDAAAETMAKTSLAGARAGRRVHLERALRLSDRLGGHLMTGHVDGLATVVGKRALGEALELVYEVPEELARHVAPKGCIAVDGVSLTVNGVSGRRFDVVLVPFTRRATHLDGREVGDQVNVETDVISKYVARLLGARAGETHETQGITHADLAKLFG